MEQSKLEQVYTSIIKDIEAIAKETDVSRIEMLGEALYSIDTTDVSFTDARKAFQFAYLKQAQEEKVQANHQITPDAIGYLISHILGLYNKNESFKLLDIGSGSGHLSMTVSEQLENPELHGVEIDATLAQLNVALCEYLERPMEIYPQNALDELFIDSMDAVIGDLPIGYYPVEVEGYITAFQDKMSFAHLLLLERGMKLLEPGGVGVFLVTSNIMEQNNATIKKYLKEHVSLKMFLHLPSSIFKSKEAGKSIMVLENVLPEENDADVLLAEVPSFKDAEAIKRFLSEIKNWYDNDVNNSI